MIDEFLDELQTKKLMISEENQSVTAKEFVLNIQNKAKRLEVEGMRVYFPLERSIESLTWFFAFLKAKALLFIGNPTFSSEKLKLLFDYIQPHLAIVPCYQALHFGFEKTTLTPHLASIAFSTEKGFLDPLEKISQLAILTSGTTGLPKAVLHRFSHLLLNASLHADAIELAACDRVGSGIPPYFSYGLVAVILGALVRGASLFLAPPFVPGDPLIWLKEISVFSATPLLAKKITDFSFRVLTIGGDYTPPLLAGKILQNNPNLSLFTTYGLTEAGPRVATNRVYLRDCSLSSFPLGIFLPNVEVQMGSDDELLIKTPTVMVGYFKNSEETQKVYKNGWLHTGDLVKKEGENIYFMGRKKKLINRGGEKIYPAEIENILQRFPSIEDAYVTETQESITAYLQTQKILDLPSITSFLRRYLPRSHIPDRMECVGNLPVEAKKK